MACRPRAKSQDAPATLVLVDDDPHVVVALQLLLADDGYRILTATCAEEGFEALARPSYGENLRQAFHHFWNLHDARTGWRIADGRAHLRRPQAS